jgi:hypothetical protein
MKIGMKKVEAIFFCHDVPAKTSMSPLGLSVINVRTEGELAAFSARTEEYYLIPKEPTHVEAYPTSRT